MRAGPVVAWLCVLVGVVCGTCAAATSSAPSSRSRALGLTIHVEGGGWGSADPARIEAVLYAVADELIVRLPQKMSAPIVVTHTDRNPVTLYQRGKGGEYLMHLHASGERWYLYTYEFAHELCHIISNYDDHAPANGHRPNQWFEESMCETASLYSLKHVAATWQASAPAPEFARQTWRLFGYFDLLFNQEHRRLPVGTRLATWLTSHERQLRNDPYQREKNQLVANQLLPLFEENPENWEAICYLNRGRTDNHPLDFRGYLQHWYEHAPTRYKGFVARVVALLERGDDRADGIAANGADRRIDAPPSE